MSNHRSIIEDLAEKFEAHVNKGSLKRAAAILPDLVKSLVDMVEHHAGVKANKATVTTEAKTRAAADSDLAKEIEAVVAKVEDKIEAVVEKVETNTAAIAEVKAAPEPVETDKPILVEDTPADAEKPADEAPEGTEDKKATKGKKKTD